MSLAFGKSFLQTITCVLGQLMVMTFQIRICGMFAITLWKHIALPRTESNSYWKHQLTHSAVSYISHTVPSVKVQILVIASFPK